ncbi:hypothetical protein CTTA_4472 [Comamonas testosteroni]|uniref:Uncharacterized protein n=1 Tax=Comamonas testosteroni TaxID=285 RepID=A0A5A7MI02_COMTE|nr:hypothetical protein [Comamonas testosteroni]GEQ77467.1 hypothetical protein CTTA_4472 [Comamonas testosteroni]
MTKRLEGLILLVAICAKTGLAAVPDAPTDEPQGFTQSLRDELVCLGMHAECLDDKWSSV